MRTIVYTGKGGVGKTSVAAATALRCADKGYRTLIISTDTAHSLGDSLQVTLGPEPSNVTTNLDAQEIDVHYSIEKYWGDFQELIVSIFIKSGTDDMIAEEMTILPGLEEGASLLWLSEYVASGNYDVVVIDAAPTAETLRLLSLPEAARWWFDKLLPLAKTAARFLSPMARQFGVDKFNVDTIKSVEELFDRLDEVRVMLSDGEKSSMRLVVNAERMVIKETQRTYTYLNLYGYPVDAIICNRIIPESVTDPYFQAWKDSQQEHLGLIHECFDPLTLLTSPLFQHEVGGLDRLRLMGDALFGDTDPADKLYTGTVESLVPEESGGYIFNIPLPLAEKGKLDLYHATDELTLSVGAYRRNIALPRVLWSMEVISAKLEEGVLVVRFAPEEEDKS